MKKNYIIPYGERFTSIGKHPYATSVMSVDNIGVVVAHPRDYKPTDDDLRRHLIGWSEQRTQFLQAESLEEALKEFMSYPECNTGIVHKAWQLLNSKDKPVKEYSACEHMRITKGGSIACGYYDEPTDGGHMVCVLGGLDEPPEACQINNQMEHKGYREEVVEIGGVWVKRYQPTVKEMDELTNGVIAKRVNK